MGKSLLVATITLMMMITTGCQEKWEPKVDWQKKNGPEKTSNPEPSLKKRVANSLKEIKEIR